MKKVIKAQMYINQNDEEMLIKKSKHLDQRLSDDIEYIMYLGELKNEIVCGFNVEIVCDTKKEAESKYKWFIHTIKNVFDEEPTVAVKLNIERV